MGFGQYQSALWPEADVPEDPELPVGAIAMWSPLNGAVPSGWAECDGTANAPGPDLRNRFIVARGSGHTVDTTGGSATSILNHTHPVLVTDPGHDHDQRRHATTTGGLSGLVTAPDTSSSNPQVLGPNTGPRATGVTATTSNPSGGVASLEPPWYALIYIQRMT